VAFGARGAGEWYGEIADPDELSGFARTFLILRRNETATHLIPLQW
jgi:hypothetical protein